MSLAEIQEQVAALSAEEQKKLMAYLLQLNRLSSPKLQRETAEIIDDREPGFWMTIDEVWAKLDQKEAGV